MCSISGASSAGNVGSVSGSTSASGIISVSGIILAGGSSSRLGKDKALVRIAGRSLIERVIEALRSVVSEIVLVSQTPEPLAFLELPVVADIYPGVGTLGGLHAGLSAIDADYGLAVGCDMPFLSRDLLRYMISQAQGYDVVMPRIGEYSEPLHALYARRCMPLIEQRILSGQRRILHACAGMRTRYIGKKEITLYDPEHLAFFNVNTPEDLERARAILASS